MLARSPFDQIPLDLGRALDDWFTAVEEVDRQLGAFVELLPGPARGDVARLPAQPLGRLHGVPVGVKELFRVRGALHGNGSLVPGAGRQTEDAAVVERLRSAGAIVVGTTRSHEFGWGITTHHATRGSTRNPGDRTRVAGGSSGGSAAAVAAGLVPLAIGTDTGGSVRIPAAFCGVLGLKTTLGRISRVGCTPLAPSFDTVGLFARSIEMLWRGLSAVAGPDLLEPVTLAGSEVRTLPGPVGSFRFALPDQMQPQALGAGRRAALDDVAAALRTVDGVQLDAHATAGATAGELFVPQIMAEAHFVHHRILGTWPQHAASYGRDVAARLRASESVDVDDYLSARAATDGVRADFARLFADVDVVVDVVGAAGPSTLDDPDHVEIDGKRVRLMDVLMPSTLLQNLGGLPSLTVPVSRDTDGLPIAVQLTGPPWSEETLLGIGRRLEALGVVDTAS